MLSEDILKMSFKILNVSITIVREKNSLKWWIDYIGLENQWQNRYPSGVHDYFLNLDFLINFILIQFQIYRQFQV